MKALEKNKTWGLVSLPRGKEIVAYKCVFIVKHRTDGSIERYKTRLVAKRFTQTYGVNYEETFVLVAKLNSIRVLLSPTTNINWFLQQLNVKNTFLNGNLAEDMSMSLSLRFDGNNIGSMVYKWKKSLHCLKQPSRV